ncbi:SIMPL domain-containing protein [Falsiroseomonas ponticola]|jgi:uncharacterized protein YggE|uniref:SIMPL domain-containing protein n=1 Tax=Falsiroseomonas ponticola TaxID=2786951 RepID=UPI001933C977|nr:SIMPL domain-containing protein [Roseomonas ponticola]
MHRRLLILGAALATLPALAAAQPVETTLHLSETAEISRAPDEVVATLRAEARAPSAAAAQEAVNRAITAAVTRAQAVSSIRVSTGGYWTARGEEGRGWQAAQSVTLRGAEAAPLLDLAATLQSQGLAMQSLTWTLTRDAARMAREEASRLALDALRRRADALAAQLNLAVAGIREVRIDAPDRAPRPVPMAAMRASSASGPTPPVAIAEDITVAATVEAVVVLRPR